MVVFLPAVVAVLGCAASSSTAAAAAAAGRRARSDSTATCDIEDGNRYCSAVNHIGYKVNLVSNGFYREVVNMDLNTGKCDFQDKKYSGPLAPFNEPMSVHFRGPIKLKQFAVYVPKDQATPSNKQKREGDGSINLAKKDVDYVSLDLGKLEQQTTRNIVWVTETSTHWTTVTARVGANNDVKPAGDGAACGVAAAPSPVSIKSQGPMVPIHPSTHQPLQDHSTVTASTDGSGASKSTQSEEATVSPITAGSVQGDNSVTPFIISTSTNSGTTEAQSTTSLLEVSPLVSSSADPLASSSIAVVSSIQTQPTPSSAGDAPRSSSVAIVVLPSSSGGSQTTTIAASSDSSSSSTSSAPSSSGAPSPNSDPTVVTPGAAFHRVAYYHARTQQASNLVFLGNKGDGVTSGQFNPQFGASLSYITPNASLPSSTHQMLANDTLIPSGVEFSIFSSLPCSDPLAECGYTRPGENIPAFEGFSASGVSSSSSRIFLFEFSMPHDPNPPSIKTTTRTAQGGVDGGDGGPGGGGEEQQQQQMPQYDTPAIWLLNHRIPLTQQYGPCSCWGQGGFGCGEFDVFETLSVGEGKAVTSIKAAGGSGAGQDSNGNNNNYQGLSDWLERPTDEEKGIRLAVGIETMMMMSSSGTGNGKEGGGGGGGIMWVSVLGEGDDGRSMFEGELDLGLVGRMRDGKVN